MNYIYALSDPLDNIIRYIGKTNNLDRRVRRHLTPGNLKKKHHTAKWLNWLINVENRRPMIQILEEVPDAENWKDKEIYWIAYYKEKGNDLTNITKGGEGGATYGRLGKTNSKEHKEKCSKARTGVPINQTDKEGKRALGIKKSIAERKALGIPLRPPHSEETKRKIGEANKGKNMDKARAAVKSRKGKKLGPMSEETKLKISASKKGVPWTDKRRKAQNKNKGDTNAG